MSVSSQDGERLGRVFATGEERFQIEKGVFFPRDYVCSYADIADVRGDEVILRHGRESLRRLGAEGDYEQHHTVGGELGLGSAGVPASGLHTGPGTRTLERASSEVSVPVSHEELDVIKRERQAGEVRVEKHVVAEEKELEVPVRKERVRVERRAVEPGRPAAHATFEDETLVVPLRAEEVEVHKHAVVREEVVLHKETVEEQRRVAETVRREEVDVRTEGRVDAPEQPGFSAPSDDPRWRR